MTVYSRVPVVGVEAPVYGYGSYHHRGRSWAFLLRPFKHVLGYFNGAEWLRLILVFVTTGIAMYSVQRANWVASHPPFVLILLTAILSTAIVLKLRLRRAFKVAAVLALGIIVVAWQAILSAGNESVLSALSAAPNESAVYFAVFVLALTWTVGTCSAWFILEKKNAWIPAGLGAIVVLVNLSNLPPEHYNLLPVYFLSALTLVGLNHMLRQRAWFFRNGAGRSGQGSRWFVTSVVAISGLAVIASAWVPQTGIERVGFDASGQFVTRLEKDWFNIFASVPGKWSIIRSEDMKTLLFSSPLDNRETVLFVVTSTQPSYWRINRYDEYRSWGWTSSLLDDDSSIQDPTLEVASSGTAETERMSYSVENRSKTDLILLAGEFVSSSITVKLARPAPAGTDPDVLSVMAPQLMQPHARYEAVVGISSATSDQLSKAGIAYPAWVSQRYLQLPGGLSPRIRQTTLTLTNKSSNTYEKALAIQEYLRGLKYNRDAKTPSRSGDEVASFLFVQKEGVCTDFATAMIVMLRTIGVPARLATGYLPGEHATGTETYLVRGKDYHAWPEVYFPTYGWISFDPTPRQGVDTELLITGPTGPSSQELLPEDLFVPDGGAIPGDGGNLPATPKQNIILPIIVVTLLAASMLGLLWTFGRRLYLNLRLSSSATGVYAKMCRFASAIGLAPGLAETPLEYGQRLASAVPEGSEHIDRVARLYVESRFSPRKDLEGEQLDRLQKSWVQLYPILFKRRLPWNR